MEPQDRKSKVNVTQFVLYKRKFLELESNFKAR